MSLGYCKTIVKDLNFNIQNPSALRRFDLTSSMPDRFKLIGVSASATRNSHSSSIQFTIQTFKLYDGDSGSDESLLLTFPLIIGASALAGNCHDFIMQNDSYVHVKNGLYYNASSNVSDINEPLSVTVMYV
jgi:hypothetical protein